jgi:hypothetical protein
MAVYILSVSYKLSICGLDISLLLILKALDYYKDLFKRPGLKELGLYYKVFI